ncbi:beta-ketoacyl synthase N-terminal-like domain-containing protein [Siccirubricoccus phaeus]|uniref:beta-ketoacyl synthase N-terminal-like domain-containing protein n=1 Tax=Siccirubricoccus phaeus TaxID=2595053 RepID=UPI0011F26BF9|nr:beta-ketoacyl synthase N-terminal-like domain-containing protein [Siccirubricoccus phaeus]
MPDANAAPNPVLDDVPELDGPVAIIAAACRMPGAPDPAAFWRRLFEGEDCVRAFTPAELAEAGIDPATAARPDYVGRGAILDDACDFDPAFFGYADQEALEIDPQQRLFLACAAEALQVAGYGGRAPRGSVGVFGAARMSTWLRPDREMMLGIAAPRNFQALTGNDKDYLATRVAYKLDLSGPALTVQTACSSSLVAVHMACEQLRSGACDMALAGGVGISFPQALGYFHREGMIFSPDGHCRPFAADANGTGIGHGCGVVLLKRLADALADGDEVWAVVLGSAANNDGAAKAGFTAPSVEGQAAVIAEALEMAEADPATIGLVEAHGTGTPLGDPIEVAALTRIWRRSTDARQFCALGSVKSNLGHLDTAAGIASLLKAVMALRHRVLPPTLHAEAPNPALELADSPFFLPAYALPWEGEGPRRAAVSSFGIGGTNCHVVLEEAPRRATPRPAARPVALPVPARSPAGLARHAARLAARLGEGDVCPATLAATLAHAGPEARGGAARQMLRAIATAPLPGGARAALEALAQGAVPGLAALGEGGLLRFTGATEEAATAWLRAAWGGGEDPFALAALPVPAALQRWRERAAGALPPSGLLLPQLALVTTLLALPGGAVEGEGAGALAVALARADLPEAALLAWLNALDRGEAPPPTGDAVLDGWAAAPLALSGAPAWPAAPGLAVHLAEPSPTAFRHGLELALWQAGLGECPAPAPARRVSLPPMPFEERRLYRPVAGSGAPPDAGWAAVLAAGDAAVAAITVDAARVRREHAAVAALHRHHVAQAFGALGCLGDAAPRDLDAVLREGGIAPGFRQLAGRLLEDLAAEGGVSRDPDGRYRGPLRPGAPPEAGDLVAPSLAGLIARTAPHLDAVLAGRMKLVNLVFPEGDTSDAADLYESHHYSRHLNDIAAKLAGAVAGAAGRRVTVLEVGAGTGGTTGAILAALGPRLARYIFTDIGPLFLARARERFVGVAGMEFRPLDMLRDVTAQGFAPASCDLIVAANVLHNAPSLPGVLRNLSRLLKPGGVLLLRELVERKPLFDLVFGALAPEVEDHVVRGGLFAPAALWRQAAQEAGFAATASFPEEDTPQAAMGEAIILARLPGAAAPATAEAAPPLWEGEVAQGTSPLGALVEAARAALLLPGRLEEMAAAAMPPVGAPLALRREGSVLRLDSGGTLVARARLGAPGAELPAVARWLGPTPRGLGALLEELGAPAAALTVAALPGEAPLHLAAVAGGGLALVGEGAEFPLAWASPAPARLMLPAAPEALPLLAAARWEAVPATAAPLSEASRLVGPPGGALTEALLAAGRDCVLLDGVPEALPGGASTLLLADDFIADAGAAPAERLRPLHNALAALARAARRAGPDARAMIVTRQALALPGEAVERPLAALAHGMGLALARENVALPIAVLDTDLAPASLARLLAPPAALRGAAAFGALRRGQGFRRRFAALPVREDAAWSLPEGGTVALTGGLSRLGRVVLGWLGAQGVRDVTLFLHRSPDAAEAAALAALRAAHGMEFRLLPGIDCADPAAIARGFSALEAAGAAPRAVFHLAGIVRDGLVEQQSWEAAGPVLAVKLNAAAAILEALRPHPGARAVFFSSLAAALGPPGEGAHAGANAALEAMAGAARSQGIAATAIAWDYWREALREEHQPLAARFATAGLSNAAGLAALGAALAQGEAAIVAADPAALALLAGAPAAGVAADTPAAGQEDVLAWLRGAVAKLVGRPPGEVDPGAGLIQLGIDSLMFLDLGERAARELGVTLSAEAALGAESLAELAALLERERAGR